MLDESLAAGGGVPSLGHDDIKCDRGQGNVYVKRNLVASVRVDDALRPSLHLHDVHCTAAGLDMAVVRQRVTSAWAQASRTAA